MIHPRKGKLITEAEIRYSKRFHIRNEFEDKNTDLKPLIEESFKLAALTQVKCLYHLIIS